MIEQTVTLTDLLQHSGDVLPRLDAGGIVVKRRDGEDFFMVGRSQWDALSLSWQALAAAYLEMREECDCPTGSRASRSALPWLSLLGAEDREEFLHDLVLQLQASLESGKFSALNQLLAEWRATALATWDDARNRQRPGYQEDEPVPLTGI